MSGRLGGRTIIEGRLGVFRMKLVKNRGLGIAPRLDSRRMEPATKSSRLTGGPCRPIDACPYSSA